MIIVADNRIRRVKFVDQNTFDAFESLKKGVFEEKRLAEFVQRAIGDLRENPFCGTKIPRALWPKEYVREYGVTNLWKYDLPNGWRLIYTIVGTELEIVSIILEWFSHKEYEKKFKYNVR